VSGAPLGAELANSLNAADTISNLTLVATQSEQLGASGDVPMGDHRRLHDLLVELRHRAGEPSLRKINSGCGVSVGYLSQIFAGKTAPGPDVAVRVAQALKATDREQARIRFYAEGTETDRAAQRTAEATRPRRTGWAGCPYRGLLPFEEEHATVFYGRRTLTTRLLDRLREHPADAGILLVLGPSGAGKSSLLRAGLMGSLAADNLTPGCQHWPRRVITPTSEPLRLLAIHLAELANADAISVQQALTEHPEQAHLLAGQALATAGDGRLILVVDQLEELFTLTDDPAEQQAFLAALHSLATEPVLPDRTPGALIVAGIRGDFLDQALTHTPIRQAAEAGVFTVGALSESELREAIVGPAAEAGVRIPADLCTAILDDLRERSLPGGFDCGALPLLSQVMFVMWQAKDAAGLTVAGYHRTGGVADIVRTSAEQAYDTLTPDQQEFARRAFIHLTATTGSRLTRRPSTRNTLRSATGSDQTATIIEAFATQRLLTVADNDTVTIAHEELLRSWNRLRDWIQPDLTDQALHQALTEDVHDWQKRQRDPSYLYQGGRLLAVDDALPRWAADPAQHFPLNRAAEEFLSASRRRARRRRRAYKTVAAVVVLLLASTATAAVLAIRQQKISLSRQLAAQSTALMPHNPELADLLAVQAYRISPTNEAVDSLYAAVAQPIVRTLTSDAAVRGAMAYSRDGRHLAVPGDDGTVSVWDLGTGERQVLAGHDRAVSAVAYSSDGSSVASAGEDGAIRIWDLGTGQSRTLPGTGQSRTLPGAGERPYSVAYSVAYSPDGRHLAGVTNAVGESTLVRIWDLSTGESQTLTGTTESAFSVAYSPGGRQLAVAGLDGVVQVWDLATGRSETLTDATHRAFSVAFSRDGRQLAGAGVLASGESMVRIWDLGTGKSRTLKGPAGSHVAVAYDPEGRHVASAAGDSGEIRIWELDTGNSHLLVRHAGEATAVVYSPDGRQLATGGTDRTVRIWDSGTVRSRTLTGHTGGVSGVAFAPNGRNVASAGQDGAVLIWDLGSGESRALAGKTDEATAVAYHPDGRHVASARTGSGVAVRIWDLDTGEQRVLNHHTGHVTAVAYSPDGKRLASAGGDATVQLWDLNTGSQRTLTGYAETVAAVAFSPDEKTLASGSGDATIQIWDVAAGRKLRVLKGHTGVVSAVAYSADGRHLASGSDDRTVRVWDLDSGESRELTGHSAKVTAVAHSPDKHHVASASDDGTVQIWDLDTGKSRILTGHKASVTAVTYSPDGWHLASASMDQTVRVWANAGLTPAAATELVCGVLTRDLTSEERRKYVPSTTSAPRACPQPAR
jgi:WD40 repeat protein/transcriptional regulator with XRE-family HTH domain